MTKTDFREQYPFSALEYATHIFVRYTDGDNRSYTVANYWPYGAGYVDVVECVGEREPLYFPHPSIAWVRVEKSSDRPNRDSRQECAYVVPTIDALFRA